MSKKLVKRLKEANDAYHNGDPIMSDRRYDRLLEKLKKQDPENKFLKKIGSSKIHGDKCKLPVPMGSLSKERPSTIEKWIKKFPPDSTWFLTPKLDGLAGLLHYKNSKLYRVYTRGDGHTGRVVTENARYVQGVLKKVPSIPSQVNKKEFFVRGEFIIHDSLFDESMGKNPRNFCVGMINRKEPDKKNLKKMTFITFGLEGLSSKWQEIQELRSLGFTTITCPGRYSKSHKRISKLAETMPSLNSILPMIDFENNIKCWTFGSKRLTAEYFEKAIKHMEEVVDIQQDGLVLTLSKYLDYGLESDGISPAGSKSIKLDVKNQKSKKAYVERIRWSLTSRGIYKPVVYLKEPINFNGIMVSKVYGHNYDYVFENQIGEGASIKMVRSGDVIPYITKIRKRGVFKALKRCKYCKTKLKISNVDLYCPNKDCKGIKKKQLYHFFKVIKVDSMSDKTVQQLIEAKIDSVPKLIKVRSKDLLKIEGFAKKKAKTISKGLRHCLDDIPLEKLMSASGFFSDETASLGEIRLRSIIDCLGKQWLLSNGKITNHVKFNVNAVEGVGPTTVRLFCEGLNDFRKFYYSIQSSLTIGASSGNLTGMGFCFTGFRSAELENLIKNNGGVVYSSVTKKVNVLFSSQMDTAKTKKAESQGVEIVGRSSAQNWIDKRIQNNEA